MVELSEYAIRVIDRLSMMGNWLAVLVSIRNLFICWRLYRRTRGSIHLVNTIQVVILMVDRTLYGIIPLFEIHTCAFFPLLISFWHICKISRVAFQVSFL
ncbi:hypothetical protein BX666DRAFT_369072 [Dichotomocladium elegans]|nr:hypothetical protein BX666DRAFT_369072 [Dichotomocladium elegans]